MRIVQGSHGIEEAGAGLGLEHPAQGFGGVRRELQGIVLARRDVGAFRSHVALGDRATLQQCQDAFSRFPQQRTEVLHPFRGDLHGLGAQAGAASEADASSRRSAAVSVAGSTAGPAGGSADAS
jgi:hypothetical protein